MVIGSDFRYNGTLSQDVRKFKTNSKLSLDLTMMCFLHGVSVVSVMSVFWGFFISLFDLKSYHLKFLLTAETKRYNPVKQ